MTVWGVRPGKNCKKSIWYECDCMKNSWWAEEWEEFARFFVALCFLFALVNDDRRCFTSKKHGWGIQRLQRAERAEKIKSILHSGNNFKRWNPAWIPHKLDMCRTISSEYFTSLQNSFLMSPHNTRMGFIPRNFLNIYIFLETKP